MDPFSVSVGVLTIVDTCSKLGKVLIRIYDDHQSAETEVAEMLLKLKAIWNKTETQMLFLQKIWDSLDSNFQVNQILLLNSLETKLQKAVDLLNSILGAKSQSNRLPSLLTKRGGLGKTKYVLGVKDSIDKVFSEILEWRDLFDPSWYLLSRVANIHVDQNLDPHSRDEPLKLLTGLRKSVRELNPDTASLPVRSISSRDFLGQRVPIESSPITVALIEGRVQNAVVDTMLVNPRMDEAGTTRSVIALSKALSKMDPSTFGLLRCCGVINKTDRYEFVFEIPQELQSPRSLRYLLNSPQPSLNVKVELAKQLAKSVFYVHAAGFVHKNICPETILVFARGGESSLFLCGFQNFRATKDDTFRIGDSLPERELYRHPLRQGDNPERRYVMQHDIYSLGVCLLEIGLWRSFVRSEGDKTLIEFEQHDIRNDARKRAFAIKRQLLVTMDEQLRQHTGERYKSVVEICLTCLDDDVTWHQADDKGGSGTEVGVEFIENVLLQLHEIVV